MNTKIIEIVQELMLLIVDKKYEEAETLSTTCRVPATDIKRTMEENEAYGIHFIPPPFEAFEKYLDIIRIKDPDIMCWSIVMPFWSVEEGRSDLSMDATVAFIDGKMTIELDGILVH